MKTWTLRIRASDAAIFDFIVSGRKSVETRAATAKYRAIAAGDHLVFKCGSEAVEIRVETVQYFHSIEELFSVFPVQAVFPSLTTVEQAAAVYVKFPAYQEKIAKAGIVAFTLSPVQRPRAAAIIVRENKILLTHRCKRGVECHIIPGGAIDPGESPEQTVARELREEAGIEIVVEGLLFQRVEQLTNSQQYYFNAHFKDANQMPIWQEQFKQRPDNTYTFEWVGNQELDTVNLKPKELREVLKTILEKEVQ